MKDDRLLIIKLEVDFHNVSDYTIFLLDENLKQQSSGSFCCKKNLLLNSVIRRTTAAADVVAYGYSGYGLIPH